MLQSFNLQQFIAEYLTGRSQPLLQEDFRIRHTELQNRVNGKAVLVIGGAGTIGSNFIKAILRFDIAKLYVVDVNENGLTELVRDLRSSEGYNIPEDFKTYPVDFGDAVFEKIFKHEGPFDIVANFAAHKHVRSEKDQYSIEAMIHNNVVKAKRLLDLLLESPPERFFCVSTDKAANPVNVMGASKKLMEEVILAYSSKLQITTARFANVAFSNGSLPAGFLERISKKQPLSSPNNVLRFFVSPIESGEICLMACILGESGDIFFPKLDPEKDMRSFSTIAEQLLNTLGYQPYYCKTEEEARQYSHPEISGQALPTANCQLLHYPVFFFESDTSGEKPYEEFYTEGEELDLDSFPNLGVIKNAKRKIIEELEPVLRDIENLFKNPSIDKENIVAFLKELLPGFQHIETGKGLDQKM